MTKLDDFAQYAPSPDSLLEEAKAVVSRTGEVGDIFYDQPSLFENDNFPGFVFYTWNDGAGQEGRIVFYSEADQLQALIFAYEHESDFTPPLDGDDLPESVREAAEGVWEGVPEVFLPALHTGSPLLWNWEGYPTTHEVVYATACIWNVGEGWSYSSDEDTANERASHLIYGLKDFPFIQKFKEQSVK